MSAALKTISAKDLKALLDAHDKAPDGTLDLAGYNLANADLSGRNLDNIDFTGSSLSGANLNGAAMGAGTILKSATIDAHDFTAGKGVDLSDVPPENLPEHNPALAWARANSVRSNFIDGVSVTLNALANDQRAAGQTLFKDGDDMTALATKYLQEAQRAAAEAQKNLLTAITDKTHAKEESAKAAEALQKAEQQQTDKEVLTAAQAAAQAATARLEAAQKVLEGAFARSAQAKSSAQAAQNVMDDVPTLVTAKEALAQAIADEEKAAAALKADASQHRPTTPIAHAQDHVALQTSGIGDFGPGLDGTDGKKGPETVQGILDYQQNQGLAQTGHIDAATAKRMNIETQQALLDLGYLKAQGGRNPVDGAFGAQSHNAVRAFQTAHAAEGLKATGTLDHDTRELLAREHGAWLGKPENSATLNAMQTDLQQRMAAAPQGFADPAGLLNVAQYDATRTGIQTGTGLHFTTQQGKPDEARAFLTAEQRKNLTLFADAHQDIIQKMFGDRARLEGSDLVVNTKDMTSVELRAFYDNRVVLQRALKGDADGAVKASQLQADQSMTPYQAATTLHADAAEAAGRSTAASLDAQTKAQLAALGRTTPVTMADNAAPGAHHLPTPANDLSGAPRRVS